MPYPELTATLPESKEVSNGYNYAPEKELIEAFSLVAFYKGQLEEVVCMRGYMARSKTASVYYASIWVRDRINDRWYSGTGQAGGYGYHRGSAALDYAIKSAGITLSRSIHGTGEMEEALEAIAKAVYPRAKKWLVCRH
jgi:hypothetical protein